jgi:hypothetical protein
MSIDQATKAGLPVVPDAECNAMEDAPCIESRMLASVDEVIE